MAVRPLRQSSSIAYCTSPNLFRGLTLTSSPVSTVRQIRTYSFLNNSSIQSTSQQRQRKGSKYWMKRKREERSARSKISTLAAYEHQELISQTQYLDSEDTDKPSREKQNNDDTRQRTPKALDARTRRLLLWATLLTIPFWGRDVVEVVVPGTLGIFILVAGKIKSGIQWVHSGFSQSER